MTAKSPHSIVLVFDNPEATASLRQILVTHESLEVHAAYTNDVKPPQKLNPTVSKQLVATKLGRRTKVAQALLEKLAERYSNGGAVIFSTEEVAAILDEAAEETPVADIGFDVPTPTDSGGFVYEDPLSEAAAGKVVAADIVIADGAGTTDLSGKIALAVVGGEEDAA